MNTMVGRSFWIAIVCLLCLMVPAPLCAQDATGRIIGTVTDSSGAVVPNAKVAVTNVATKISRDTVSTGDGSYQILLLPIGMYQLSAEAPGFSKIVTSPEKLGINQSLRIDLKLEVGAASQTVQVEANASRVETVTATLGHAITASQIAGLPLNGRNVLDLALLSPGVIPNTAGNGSFSVAGGRGDSVTYLLDGAVNNNLLSNAVVYNPNPDTVDEFRILINNYTAEFGRNAGGIVSVVLKSGSNTFHGSAYDYLRNGALNANSFFNNANKLPKETLKRNQFGAAVGGPVTIPKLINGKDRLFFFLGYQGQRQSSMSTTSKVTVFTPAELNGDFSLSNSGRTGPDTKVVSFLQQFPYFQADPALAAKGIIAPSRINSVAQKYIKAGWVPTAATGFLTSQGSATTNNDELTEKIDLLITPTDRVTVSLGERRQTTVHPFGDGYANVPGFPNNRLTHSYFGSVDYTKTISTTMINDFRMSAQRNNGLQAVPGLKLPTPQQLGIAITPDEPTGPTRMWFSTGMQLGFSPQGPSTIIDNTYTWQDTLSWMRGSHNLKMGLSYTPYQDNQVFDFYVNGEYSFSGTGGGIGSGNDHADFLFGLPDELYQAPAAPSNIRTHNFAGFFQDEWKIRPNFTLTLGMRYEYSSPKLDLQGRTFSPVFGQQSKVFPNAPKGLLFPGDAAAPRGANYPDRNDWAPRLGFAWSPHGSTKTSIRGGVGVFYDILKAEDNFQFNGQPPFFAASDLYFDELSANPTSEVNYMSAPYVAAGRPNPFPSTAPPKDLDFAAKGLLPFGGAGVYFIDPRLRTPYIFQYNLSVQREIMHDTVLEISYAGSSSHKLTGLIDTNPMVLGTTTRLYNAQPGVASGSFSYFDTFTNVANANYNSLEAGLNRRARELGFIGSVGWQLSYTHGKSIDNASGFRTGSSRVPYYEHKRFRGVSDYDLTDYVNFSGNWELPFAKAWPGGPKRLTSGWTLWPMISYRSGQPLNVRAGLSRTATRPGPSAAGDANLVQANLLGPINYYDAHLAQTLNGKTGNFYFNPAAFSTAGMSASSTAPVTNPALRTYGTLGRNAFRGLGRGNVDFSLIKYTNLVGERVKSELHVDFFNLFNHTEFGNPNTSITSGTFGQISTTAAPRIIQLALRLTF